MKKALLSFGFCMSALAWSNEAKGMGPAPTEGRVSDAASRWEALAQKVLKQEARCQALELAVKTMKKKTDWRQLVRQIQQIKSLAMAIQLEPLAKCILLLKEKYASCEETAVENIVAVQQKYMRRCDLLISAEGALLNKCEKDDERSEAIWLQLSVMKNKRCVNSCHRLRPVESERLGLFFNGVIDLVRVAPLCTTCANLSKLCWQTDLVSVDLAKFTELTVIEQNAFGDCRGLKSITFPRALRRVGTKAFGYCDMLREMDFLDTGLSEVGDEIIFGCSRLSFLRLPAGLLRSGDWCFATNWRGGLGKGTLLELENVRFWDVDRFAVTGFWAIGDSRAGELTDMPLTCAVVENRTATRGLVGWNVAVKRTQPEWKPYDTRRSGSASCNGHPTRGLPPPRF